MASEPIVVLLRVISELERIGVRYAIGGSVASSVFGEPRASEDADLIADLGRDQAEQLVTALAGEFYLSEPAIRDALTRHSSFNVIHLKTMRKVDVFVAGPRPLDRTQIERRCLERIAEAPERLAYFVSAEDIILVKLDWYRKGGCVSDRQWNDVLGVLKVQGSRLDFGYMVRTAVLAGIEDLLAKAIASTGLPPPLPSVQD